MKNRNFFRDNFRKFLPTYLSGGNPTDDTLKDYEYEIGNFLKWTDETRQNLFRIDEHSARIYVRELYKQNYSPATIQLKVTAARKFYDIAINLKYTDENPFQKITVKIPKKDDTRFEYFTNEEIREIYQSILQDEHKTEIRLRNVSILMLMAVEGLRTVEVHRLNDEDINFEQNRILVRGKGHQDFIYPCPDTLSALKEYISIREEPSREGVLTPTFISYSEKTRGDRISRNGIRYAINHILIVAGKKKRGVSCHAFRHSCGTNLYRETKDLRLVQETLRHQNPKITSRYAHVNERLDERRTARLSPM